MSTLSAEETYYSNLGELIRAWRKFSKLSQEKLAERVGVSAREIRRWESRGEKQSIPGDENLEDLAEATRIPFGVILSLASRFPIPVFYCMRHRHYSSAPDGLHRDYAEIMPRAVDDVHAASQVASVVSVERAQQVEQVLEYHYSVYPSSSRIAPELLLRSAKDAPQFNLIVNDPWGHFAGYSATLLISPESYESLVVRERDVASLTLRDLRRFDQPHVMLIFSGYAAHKTITMTMLKHYFESALELFRRFGDREIAAFAVSRNGVELLKHFEFTTDFRDYAEQTQLEMDITPTFAHTTLKEFVNTAFGGCLKDDDVA